MRAWSWAALSALCLLGCDNDNRPKLSAPLERSQVVAAAPGTPAPSAPAASSAAPLTSSAEHPKPHKKLCDGQLRDGRSLPKKPISHASVAGGVKLPEELTAAPAGLTWINFWAAWCAPCKEEIPRLVGWEKQLAGNKPPFRLAFVSLDDDERQLNTLLEGSSSLKSTYWLREGREREDWMKAAGLDVDPELPVHLLVDSHGKIRCKVQGAVDDRDLADLRELLTDAR
jgi:thiol-disulfide isomerase/thioredoxin